MVIHDPSSASYKLMSETPDHARAQLFFDLKGERTLAAIVLTDTVGFSARMSVDEELTLTLIDTDLSLMAGLCQQHEGVIIKSTGDGLLMYFTSVSQAVQFAIVTQQHMEDYRRSGISSAPLSHRMGIHMGEVFLSATDVMGHAVNIAARLEGLAQPGGICISQVVYESVRAKLSVDANCLGLRQLKNIRDPILVYHLLGSPDASEPELAASHEAAIPTLDSESVSDGIPQSEPSPPSLTQQDYHDRQVVLSKVRNFWVKGVLENSLHGKVVLELGLEERPESIAQPWGLAWESTQTKRHLVRAGVPAIDLFDKLGTGATLLILGTPGSGKTITLLQITSELIARAEADPNYAIPVVFNLSAWAGQPLDTWLAAELSNSYQLPQQIGRQWIESQELILMLDGLDEVAEYRRESCVKAINQFHQTHRHTEMVVCSRLGDYEALTDRLQFQGAIFIQPLTDEQVQHYWAQTGEALAGVREMLAQNESLREWVKSPLILSLISIAYQGLSASELTPLLQVENPTRSLFQLYVERMVERQRHHQPYSRRQTQRWLKWLALRMFLQAQSVFSLEQIQPDLLQHRLHLWVYRLGVGVTLGTVYGFLFGFIYRIIIALPITTMVTGSDIGPFFLEEVLWRWRLLELLSLNHIALTLSPGFGVMIGLAGTLPAALMGQLDEIKPIESLQWSWRRTRLILFGGIITGVLFQLVLGGGGAGLILGLVISLLFSVGWVETHVQSKTMPNEGIWRSAAIATSLIWLVDLSILGSIWLFMNPLLFQGFMHSLGFGFSIGLLGILRSKPVVAGVAVIQHCILRIVLWVSGSTPRNYARWLRYVVRCALMQQVGSGYVFIHRRLLEYLALKEQPLPTEMNVTRRQP